MFKPPYLLISAGSTILFGAGLYEYSKRYSIKTGFQVKDPDPSLRKVEKDVLIPKIMRDLSRTEDCAASVKDFNECVRQFEPGSWKSYLTFKYCKTENAKMLECMNKKFTDYNFYLKCKKIYLDEKKLFDYTNVIKKDREVIKEFVKSGKAPEFTLKGDLLIYYNSVKGSFEKSNDIDSFDKEYLAN